MKKENLEDQEVKLAEEELTEEGVSRRNLLKGVALGAAGIAVASLLPKTDASAFSAVPSNLQPAPVKDPGYLPATVTMTPLTAPYLTRPFNRFGKMDPSPEQNMRTYLMMEEPFHIIGNIYFCGDMHACCYVIDTGEGLLILDTPSYPRYGLLLYSMMKMGLNPKDVKWMILSHEHGDHYGCMKMLQYVSGAKVYVGSIAGKALLDADKQKGDAKYQQTAKYDEIPHFDYFVEDGEITTFGNTSIRWKLTPGHTDGGMSHFWDVVDHGKVFKVGIYGSAGFSGMTDARLKSRGLGPEYKQVFYKTIDSVWDEKVDVMLGNHPFHADLYQKAERVAKGDKNAFIDPTEWHRFLTELRTCYTEFLKLTPDQQTEMYTKSYLFLDRPGSLPYHEWPNPIPPDPALKK